MTKIPTPASLAAVQATAAFQRVEAALEAVRRNPCAATLKALAQARAEYAAISGLPCSDRRVGTRRILSVAAAGLLCLLSLQACVAPHQHAFDDAMNRCRLSATGNSPECVQAYQLGQIVQQENAQQAAAADAFAASMLAVSAGLAAAAAAAQQPRVAPVYVYCPYGC